MPENSNAPLPLFHLPDGTWSLAKEKGRGASPVFINSIPKAGTYLLGELLHRLGVIPTDAHMWETGLHDYRNRTRQEMIEHYQEFTVSCPIEQSAHWIQAGQFAVGHLFCRDTNRRALAGFKVFFVYRELRSCLVSHMRFYMKPGRGERRDTAWKKEPDPKRRMEQFLALYAEELIGWYREVLGWIADPWVEKICYETLMGDEGAAAQIRLAQQIASFVGISLEEKEAQRLLSSVIGAETKTWSGARSKLEDYWTPQCEALFQIHGGPTLNRRLGYAAHPTAQAKKSILQRLRFNTLTPSFPHPENSLEKFDPQNWMEQCGETYWKQGPGVHPAPQSAEGLLFAKEAHVSADTFFNAFFSVYWRKLTTIESIGLRLELRGRFRVEVLRHNELGETESLLLRELETGAWDLPIDLGSSGSWGLRLSFTLTALEADARLLGGGWVTLDAPTNEVRLTAAIATYHRKNFAEPLCRQLLNDPILEAEGVRLHVVEQSDAPELESLASDRCQITRQRNVGGAGGFARALATALEADEDTAPTHLLLMDDDVVLESDSVLRALRMMQFAKAPFLLGGVMLDLHRPALASSLGQSVIKNHKAFYSIKEHLLSHHVGAPQAQEAMSLPYRSDYCAWWFCVVPMALAREIGLPAPIFFRGDDVEYGVRAKAHGIPSQVIPGIAVWHVPFKLKVAPWIKYFELYNNFLLNCNYGVAECEAAFRSCGLEALYFLCQRKYQETVALLRAMEDFAGGWEKFKTRTFPEYLHELKKEISAYPDDGRMDLALMQTLQTRLRNVGLRFPQQSTAVQKGIQEGMRKTFTPEHWKRYFEEGNSAFLA